MSQQPHTLSDLKQLADGIVLMFGRCCEVAIHDLTDLRKSLVYIAGKVTGREPGAPATDLLVRTLAKKDSDIKDMYNYKTSTGDGRSIKSSTIFLRNQEGRAVTAFCINLDTTDFFYAAQTLSAFLNQNGNTDDTVNETFTNSAVETIDALFDQALVEIGKQPASMTTGERILLVSLLEDQGIFRIKGAVNTVAERAGVSIFTIYNYLKKIRHNGTTTDNQHTGEDHEKTDRNQ